MSVLCNENRNSLISIVMPIYNIEKYLDKCMESILSQSYTNLEILMIDDGSTDSCGAKCDEYAKRDSRVIVFHKTNGGLSDARNYGIDRAHGEYITCVDSDDFVDTDYISYMYELVLRYHTKMAICQSYVHFDNGKIENRGVNQADEVQSSVTCLERMLYHDVIDTSAWGKLYHKDLFENIRYPVGKLFEDIGTTYKLMLLCDNIAVGYEPKYHYIFHNNSIVNGNFNLRKLDLLSMTDEMAKELLELGLGIDDAVIRRQVYARLSTLNQMIGNSEYSDIHDEIVEFIIANKDKVLNNPKTPRRDKLAIRLLVLDERIYNICWETYVKIKKGTKG